MKFRFFKRLVISIDKLKPRKFEIRYFCGNKSQPVSWRKAQHLAKKFGGQIYHISSGLKLTTYYSLSELL